MSIITHIAGIAGAVTLVATLAGCGDTPAGPGSNSPAFAGSAANCQPPPQPNITPDTPTIAILGAEGHALAPYAKDTGVVVDAAKAAKARIIVNGISGSADAPNLLANVVLVGEGNNNLVRTNDLNCKAAKVDEAIDILAKGKSAPTPNVFAALNALAGNLSHNPSKQSVDVVLLTPLAARGGGVDLSNPKTLADPVAAINTLAAKGLVPSCENWRLYGVSPSTGLSDVMAAQLKDFWIRYAHKCGGALVAWEDHLAAFPSTTPIAPADTSQIKVEQTKTEVIATLGSDVLFAADSANLLDPNASALGELLNLANENAGKIVITGHVNPTGGGSGTVLSLQRATTVKDWLVDHDVDENRISVIGKGAADPLYPDPKTDAEKAANRRVVTVIHTER